jgi:type II secretory pathway component PulM
MNGFWTTMKRFWQRLSARERTLVGLTGVVLVAILGQYLIAAPFLERRAWVKGQLDSQPQLLEKNLHYLGQKQALATAFERAQNEIKSREPRLLTGDTPSVSASDLQETVQGLATREGTQVITTRVLNPEPAGSFSKIAIQMEVGGQIEQITSLIRGVETSPKLLVIDEINVRSLFRPIGFPQPQGVPQIAAQNLRVSITVAGYARAQPAPIGKTGNPTDATKRSGPEQVED